MKNSGQPAAHESAHALKPIGGHRGSAAYRLALARNLLEKFAA